MHVVRDDNRAKFWLGPVVLVRNDGFKLTELRIVLRLVVENETRLLEAWDEYFGS